MFYDCANFIIVRVNVGHDTTTENGYKCFHNINSYKALYLTATKKNIDESPIDENIYSMNNMIYKLVNNIHKHILGNIAPDLTFVLRVDLSKALFISPKI